MKRLIKKTNDNDSIALNLIVLAIKNKFNKLPDQRSEGLLIYKITQNNYIQIKVKDSKFIEIRCFKNDESVDFEVMDISQIRSTPDLILQYFKRMVFLLQKDSQIEDNELVVNIFKAIKDIYSHSRLCQRDNDPFTKEEIKYNLEEFNVVEWVGYVSEGYITRTLQELGIESNRKLIFVYMFTFYPDKSVDFKLVDELTGKTLFTGYSNVKEIANWIRVNRNAILYSLLNVFTKNEKLVRKSQSNVPSEERTLTQDDLDKEILAACKSNNLTQVKELIKQGANVNYKDSSSLNLLHWSIRNNNIAILDFLLKNNANPNLSSSQKWTPLMEACKKKSLQAIRLLRQKNCNVNLKDVSGNTALIICVQSKFTDGVRELLSYQANRELTNNRNQKALDIANQLKNEQIIKLLS